MPHLRPDGGLRGLLGRERVHLQIALAPPIYVILRPPPLLKTSSARQLIPTSFGVGSESIISRFFPSDRVGAGRGQNVDYS